MKHFLSGFATCAVICTLLFMGSSAIADSPIKLFIDGEIIQCDVPPQIINGRVMVPARFVAEPLGARVEWDERSRTVIILSPNYKLPGEEIMSQQTNSLSQAKQELITLLNRYNAVCSAVRDINVNTASKSELTQQINAIAEVKIQFINWQCPKEYARLCNLHIENLDLLGHALVCVRSSQDDGTTSDLQTVKEYMRSFQMNISEIQAEINSLRQKGLY